MNTTFPMGWTTYWTLRTVLQMQLDEAIGAMQRQRPSREQYDSDLEFREAQAISTQVRTEWSNLSRSQVRQLEIRHLQG